MNEVRVYDGNGNLKQVITSFELVTQPIRKKFSEHECKASRCKNLTTNKNYCSSKCQQEVYRKKELNRRAEVNALRPKLKCEVCEEPIEHPRKKYCGRECRLEGQRIQSIRIREKNRKLKLERKGEINARP
tara:strand:- start:138 stop:530 length:393 start_codon:yes stop_codon:yes gene_type:complete